MFVEKQDRMALVVKNILLKEHSFHEANVQLNCATTNRLLLTALDAPGGQELGDVGEGAEGFLQEDPRAEGALLPRQAEGAADELSAEASREVPAHLHMEGDGGAGAQPRPLLVTCRHTARESV